MRYAPMQLKCLVISRNAAECEWLAVKIGNDDRLVLFDIVNRITDLRPLQWRVVPDLLFVSVNCCDAGLADYIQHLRKRIPILFLTRNVNTTGTKEERYPYRLFSELRERNGWDEVLGRMLREKEAIENSEFFLQDAW